MAATVHHGDCLNVMATLPDDSVDAVVTDPPYGLGFMGKEWDDLPPGLPWAQECLRVLKPGGHLLAFGGSRTWHRLAVAVEDAGFEVRDSIAWLYGSGFPKSLDVSKAIDKLDAAAERLERAFEFQAWLRQHVTPQQVNEATGTVMGHHLTTHPTQPFVATADIFDQLRPLLPEVPARIEELVRIRTVESQNFKARPVTGTATLPDTTRVRLGFVGETYNGDAAGAVREVNLTAAHTPEAAAWQGWGTALKPAFEPIVVARKPLAGTVAANVLQFGTGALNVDGCRIGTSGGRTVHTRKGDGEGWTGNRGTGQVTDNGGRWPTNVVLDGHAADELNAQSGTLKSGKMLPTHTEAARNTYGQNAAGGYTTMETYGDSGGASRFFPTFRYQAKAPTRERVKVGDVAHPTVKPLELMRWLVRLVTPPGGLVLEPFAGSGTTVEAAILEGFQCIAIEREADYLPLIRARIDRCQPVAIEDDTEPTLFDEIA